MALPCSHGIARHHFSCFFSSLRRDQFTLADLQQSFSFADIVKLFVQQSRIDRNISRFTRGANSDFQLAFESRAMDNVNFFIY
jgi:hypothetical protein